MLLTNILSMTIELPDDGSSVIAVDVKKVGCSRNAARNIADTHRQLDQIRARSYQVHGAAGICFRSRYLLTNENAIETQGPQTSGEVEFVAVVHKGNIFVTAGSDHNDRSLNESWTAMHGKVFDTAKSKQMVPAVVATNAWRYEDVKDHWDQLLLKSYVTVSDRKVPYQAFSLAELVDLEYYLRRCSWLNEDGAILLGGSSGTLPTVPKHVFQGQTSLEDVTFPHDFEFELIDPVLQRTITHSYAVFALEESGSLSL
jgi:hypothetical protein